MEVGGIYQPLIARAGSCIPTPKEFRRTSILNVKSHVVHCFKCAVLAGFYRGCEFFKKSMLTYNEGARLKPMRENPNSYARIFKSETFKQNINFNGIFADQSNICIHVFKYHNKRIIPVHLMEYKYKSIICFFLARRQIKG
jgi:hypothetical protein